MTTAIPLMTDEEIERVAPSHRDSGFGSLQTERGQLPLKAMDVRARIAGLTSHVDLCQTFANPTEEALEATYIFPLPDRAAVTRFRMEVAGRVVEGVIKERGEARAEYAQAIREGKRASIMEEERPDVFTIRVGNIMPSEEATVHLTLTGPLSASDGEATFRFPLVVAPRYIPGMPLEGESVGDGAASDTDAVPDASRITPPVLLPGFPNPVRLSLRVDVDPAGLAASNLRSSLHSVSDKGGNGSGRRIALDPGERLDRDFILRFDIGEQDVATSLLLVEDEDGKGGTYALTLVPPARDAVAVRPRDVVFVLDRSGSMQGWKMVAARRALGRMVDTLTDVDRFNVYAFDNTVELPPDFGGQTLVPATDRNRFRAVEFLARVNARGGTEMRGPLVQAANALSGGYRDRDRILVLVTDGQVGNEDDILRQLSGSLKSARVFALGIDRAVNAGFLRRLAALGGGACELVESEDRLDEVMASVHRRIGTPILTEVSIDSPDMDLEPSSTVPDRLPDLLDSAPLVISGRYRNAKGNQIQVRAQTAEGEPWRQEVIGISSTNAAVGPIWARGRIRALEDQYVTGRGSGQSQLEKTIVDLSLQFSVLCRFTAFVAVDHSEVVNEDGDLHRIVQPVEMPSGWEMGPPQTLAAAAPVTRTAMLFDAAMPPMGASKTMAVRSAEVLSQEKAGRGGGLFQRLKRTVGPIPKLEDPSLNMPEEAAPPPMDLSVCRREAEALLDVVRAADASAPSKALGDLRRRLARLAADLRSVGHASKELEKLVVEYDRLDWTARLECVVEVLEALVNRLPGRRGGGKRRKSFWK